MPGRDGEHRCVLCNQLFKTDPVRQGHLTRGCDMDAPAKTGTRAEKLVLKNKQEKVQEAAGVVTIGDKRLKNVNVFKYLGFLFQANGSGWEL
jgi:hypothetical protein